MYLPTVHVMCVIAYICLRDALHVFLHFMYFVIAVDERIEMFVGKPGKWLCGAIQKTNFHGTAMQQLTPWSYTIKLDSRKTPVFNVFSASLRKVSQVDGVVKMVSLFLQIF